MKWFDKLKQIKTQCLTRQQYTEEHVANRLVHADLAVYTSKM